MPYAAKRISTNAWINDFSDNATPEGLTRNAVAAGIPANDVLVVLLDQATYNQVKESVMAPLRQTAAENEELTRQQLITIGRAIKTKLGLTNAQMKWFVRFMREVTDENVNLL